ncbi:tumor necrosis factor ligand superfamily member 14 [Carettochelys insculpta]|uniref:tumor necrosis factor ligand superfamily member 14 n=1 Tax=Carettochelys insculpta TaxID=44489 RepID=UPI003EC0AA7C
MGDGVVYPSVFVVDGQQHGVPFVPPMRRPRRTCWRGQSFLAALVLLALAGVATEGYFLLRFQKELDKANAQGGEAAGAISEKSIQDRKLNKEKPAAHVIGLIQTTENNSLQWEPSKDWAFLHDVGYQGGSLICLKPGYYYIYSKIQLRTADCPQQGQKSFITHGMYKKTPRYPEEMKLMESLMTYCDRRDTKFWQDSSFLGGIFHLEEKDEVYVKVAQRQLVQINDGTRSYFGTFMI